ncbi:hypothetical protein GCM10009122_58230 [Fulvivirga kasyanovii]|uniref:Leucine-rich repeat domain-containing protein n=1 Tax=Fulvivirga kasyanovii TaxID=396812 RepID=A0ABW9RSN6_9BACT|nr:hypothetical protein [Fulvivirga kasyanovii]MTI26757.1 hypothetical protein [Fulvivirga kasyanovii]
MYKFVSLIFINFYILSSSAGQSLDTLTIHLDSKDSLSYYHIINEQVSTSEVEAMIFVIDNNLSSWIIFPATSDRDAFEDNYPNYSLQSHLKELPYPLTNIPSLQGLDVSALGLKHLPKDIESLKELTALDISFNPIDIKNEIYTISKMQGLEELYIYGCEFTEGDILKLKSLTPSLKIFFSKKQYLEKFYSKTE